MAEETTTSEVVKKSSDGTVKISVEKYEQLVAKAAEEKHISYPTYTTVEKTPAMRAADNQMYGGLLMGAGLCTTAIGAVQFFVGWRQSKLL